MRKTALFFILSSLIILSGCVYSFKGGSVPEHLKTINIPIVEDNSNWGNPAYKDYLYQRVIKEFQDDNSLEIVNASGDARLTITISSINDQTMAVSPGEIETERKVTVTCQAEYYDNIKKLEIWNNSFSGYEIYKLANPQQAREDAIRNTIEQIAEDILLAVVSGW